MHYAGFWIRVAASLLDTLWMMALIAPLLTLIYGSDYWSPAFGVAGIWDLLLNYLLPAVAIVLFWQYKSATPGKMLLGLSIVDADSGGKPSGRQFLLRYLGYYLAMLPLLLGLIWVGLDRRKQGWHDKLAGTLVIKTRAAAQPPSC